MKTVDRVKTGQIPSASHTNKVVSTLNELINQHGNTDALNMGKLGILKSVAVNKTGENRKAYEVGVIRNIAQTDINRMIQQGITLTVEAPEASDFGTFVVWKNATNADGTGTVYVMGQCLASIKRTSDDAAAGEADRWGYADIKEGESVLVGQPTGAARIDWEDTSGTLTDAHFAVITFGNISFGKNSNPKKLGPHAVDAEPEAQETAYTGTAEKWDLEDATTLVDTESKPATGTEFQILTRVVYKEDGDKKIYGFYRTVTLPSLIKVSEETRYEIDAAEEC